MDQQQQQQQEPPNRLERMWKSHPWQSEAKSKSRLGPAPSVNQQPQPASSSKATRPRWAAPWRRDKNAASEIPPVNDDDLSLGDSLGEEASLGDSGNNSLEQAVLAVCPASPTKAAAPKSAASPVASSSPWTRKSTIQKPADPPAAPTATAQEVAAPVPAPTPQDDDENAELLAIDFDRDGDALQEAIADDVLQMWQEQGLYQDLPDLRAEILKGIVQQKFDALRQEQALVVAQRELETMPKFAASQRDLMFAISEEEEEEEEEEEATSEGDTPELEAQEADMNPEERHALHAFQVQEELEVRLQELDTEDHACIEAYGRFGAESKEVPIKDVHAFNKFKLHDAVEKRVSQIFTDDHQIITVANALDDMDVSSASVPLPVQNEEPENTMRRKVRSFDDAEEIKKGMMDASSASLPVLLPSQHRRASVSELRESLHNSFTAFEQIVQSKQPPPPAALDASDEWTECEVTVADHNDHVPIADAKPQDIQKLVADMDRKLGLVSSQQPSSEYDDYTEYTVHEVVDVDEVSEKRDATTVDHESTDVDVDELSELMEKSRENTSRKEHLSEQKAMSRIVRPHGNRRPVQRLGSGEESSFIEMTVADETAPGPRRRAEGDSNSGEAAKKQSLHKQHSSGSSGTLGTGNFPTITTTPNGECDDEMTQITFDHTVEGANSITQDHHLATAYLHKQQQQKPKIVSPSPRKGGASGGSEQTEPTHSSTLWMDETASISHHGSMDSNSRDAARALEKSVAKILRVQIWSPKTKVVSAAMEKLASAASQGPRQRANIARLGGAIAILQAMRSHPTHLQIQRSGCEALAHLSADDDTQEAIAEVGGTGAIVTAMESYPRDRQVQESACIALAHITRPREEGGPTQSELSDSEDDEDSPSSGHGGVVNALVTAMNNHTQDSEIQAYAFGALANLCLDDEQRLQELSESGGLTAMTMALQRPWSNKMEQHEAISTLSILLRSLAELGSTLC